MSDKTIILTITVYPFDKNKRRILVAGAPAGEMPIARSGLFHEMHDLVDQVWLDLAGRKPQTVHAKKDAGVVTTSVVDGAAPGDAGDAQESDAAETAQDLGEALDDAQGSGAEAAETAAPSTLPSIQGDDAPNTILPQGEDPEMR